MNGRDLMLAIAETDEIYVRKSEQFSVIAASIKVERKRERQTLAAVGTAAAVCAAVFGTVKLAQGSFRSDTPPVTAYSDTSGQNEPADTRNTAPDPERADDPALTTAAEEPGSSEEKEPEKNPSGEKTETELPADITQDGQITDPSQAVEDPALTADDQTAQPHVTGSGPGTPGAVLTTVNVGYAEAKETFGHPIIACSNDGFIGYKVGIVNRSGNINESGAFCLEVTYAFTSGTVSLEDQDRWSGSSYSTYGEEYAYRGRLFYVQSPDVSRDYVHVGYWPTQDSGIGYQAHFDPDADVYEIMDLIISLEI